MQIPGSDKQLFITLLDFSVVLTSFQISTSKRNKIRMPSPRPCHKAEMKISDHRGVIWEGVETSCPLSEVRNRGAWETANLPSETRCEKKKKVEYVTNVFALLEPLVITREGTPEEKIYWRLRIMLQML